MMRSNACIARECCEYSEKNGAHRRRAAAAPKLWFSLTGGSRSIAGFCRISNRDGRYERIAIARIGLDVPGRFSWIAQSRTNLIQTKIDAAIDIDVLPLAPEAMSDFLSSHNLSGPPGQQD
jgi:hypothetical protein